MEGSPVDLRAEWRAAMQRCVIDPLSGLIPARLSCVWYALFEDSAGSIDLDTPNTSGWVEQVLLDFGPQRLGVGWCTDVSEFRGSVVDCHLGLELEPTPSLPNLPFRGIYPLVDASVASTWRSHVNQPLQRLSIWGYWFETWGSPQAIVLGFPSGEVVLANGWREPETVGNWDEVLILSADQWARQSATQSGNDGLVPLWEAETGRAVLLV